MTDTDGEMIGVIDVQPTFMPGGELPVADGAAVVPLINRLLALPRARAFATQDFHPPGHVSFASTHGLAPFGTITLPGGVAQSLWPDHAIAGSANAALHPELDTRAVEVILRKGTRPDADGYSAFRDNDRTTHTGLADLLRARGVQRIYFVGLATDFCVGWSAEDAAALGFEAVVIEAACRAIGLPLPDGTTTLDAIRTRWTAAGVTRMSLADAMARFGA